MAYGQKHTVGEEHTNIRYVLKFVSIGEVTEKGKVLSDKECGWIKKMHEAGVKMRTIARAVKHSCDAFNRIMNIRGRQQATGKPPILSDLAQRLLVRTAAR